MRIVRCVKPIATADCGHDYAAIWNGARWEIYGIENVHGEYMAKIECLVNITDRMFERYFAVV